MIKSLESFRELHMTLRCIAIFVALGVLFFAQTRGYSSPMEPSGYVFDAHLPSADDFDLESKYEAKKDQEAYDRVQRGESRGAEDDRRADRHDSLGAA